MATIRGITLNRQAQSRPFVSGRGEGYRLKIDAVDAEGMPAEIFLHEQNLIDPYSQLVGEQFVCVTSVPDLTVYPVRTPDATQWPPFFRKAGLDIVVFSQSIAQETWQAIKAEVDVLIDSLHKLELMAPAEAYRAGDALTAEKSESLDVSASV